MNSGLENTVKNVLDVAIHPHNEDIVFIATLNNGIFKSTDGGNNWIPKNSGLISLETYAIAINPNNPEIIYAGFGEGVGIFKTTNGGEDWFDANLELSMQDARSFLGYGYIKDYAPSDRLVKTSISRFPSGPWTQVTSIVIDPSNPNIVYAADLGTGVYRSTDGGGLWFPINNGFTKRPITRLAISSCGKLLYAATSGAGVYRLTFANYPPEILSTNPSMDSTVSIIKGDSTRFEIIAYDLNADTLSYEWSLDGMLLEGITGSSFLLKTNDLLVGFHSLTVHIADNDTSVSVTWEINVENPTGVKEENLTKLPTEFAVMQNYPNPFNSETIIRFQLPHQTKINVSIYNILGQRIRTLINEQKEAGYYAIHWDGRNSIGEEVVSAIYIYKIEAYMEGKHFIENKKMVLIR